MFDFDSLDAKEDALTPQGVCAVDLKLHDDLGSDGLAPRSRSTSSTSASDPSVRDSSVAGAAAIEKAFTLLTCSSREADLEKPSTTFFDGGTQAGSALLAESLCASDVRTFRSEPPAAVADEGKALGYPPDAGVLPEAFDEGASSEQAAKPSCADLAPRTPPRRPTLERDSLNEEILGACAVDAEGSVPPATTPGSAAADSVTMSLLRSDPDSPESSASNGQESDAMSFNLPSAGTQQATGDSNEVGEESVLASTRRKEEPDIETLKGKDQPQLDALTPAMSVAKSLSEENKILFLFDWDDTLCPTSWIGDQRSVRAAGRRRKSDAIADWLSEQAKAVTELIRTALSLGQVAVVTLAQRPWVNVSIKEFMPEVGDEVEKLDVFYAREHPVPTATVCPFILMKKKAMQQALTTLATGPRKWDSIISVGDSDVERRAAEDLGRELPSSIKWTKTVKLADHPSCVDLTSSVRTLNTKLAELAAHPGHRHVDSKEWVEHLVGI